MPDFALAPRGMTALLTYGMENSSTEWSWDSVRALINQQCDQRNWHFIFPSSNIDTVEIGARMGMAADDAITYDSGSYMSTVAAQSAASSWIGSGRAGRKAGFSDNEPRCRDGDTSVYLGAP